MMNSNHNKISRIEQVNWWSEDAIEIIRRSRKCGMQFIKNNILMIKIICDDSQTDNLSVDKCRFIEKMQFNDACLKILKEDIDFLYDESKAFFKRHSEQAIPKPPQGYPPLLKKWHWTDNTYDGVDQLQALMEKISDYNDSIINTGRAIQEACESGFT